MADIAINEELVTRDQLTIEEQVSEDNELDVAVVRLRYRILAKRAVNKLRREQKAALTIGVEKRVNRSLKELTR